VLATVTSFATSVFGAIGWDPEIRNYLSVLVGAAVLIGSVYLIVGTNVGLRTGLLVVLSGLFGWMTTMGVVWWIYGIGLKGEEPSWVVEEINYSEGDFTGLSEAQLEKAQSLTAIDELPTAQELIAEDPTIVDEILPPDIPEEDREARAQNITVGQILEIRPEIAEEYDIEHVLSGWTLLPVSDRQRGDAAATADAFLGPDGRGIFESSADYLVLDAFTIGGKDPLPPDPSRWDRIKHEISTMLQIQHPPHYAVVQVRAVEAQETEAGEAPPVPVIDEEQPVISVIMVRDLGDKRFPAFMVTLIFGILFALTAWTLHRRDKVIAQVRAAG
jgi:hypothetical protein